MKSLALRLFVLFLFTPLTFDAQINDCSEAAIVCSSDDLAFNPDGPGYNDYIDPDNIPGCITALEQNSAWYYFQISPSAPPDLVLGFTISPNGGFGEDYDWALYGPDVDCGNLGAPIRCSSSSAQCGFCPETGMGMGTTDVSEGPGTGDGFVMTLVVQPGQGFYLMIDNWLGTTNGFVLTWTGSAAPFLNCEAKPPCSVGALAGVDFSVCEGDTDIQLNGQSTGTNGAETYAWTGTNGGTAFLSDPDIADPTITIPLGFTGTITYMLSVTEDTCTGVDEFLLTVNALPNITINQIGPFCPDDLPQALSATPPGGTWSGASTGNTFNPMTNGPGIHTVFYTYTNVAGCTSMESSDIVVHASPEVTIDPDPAEFCDSDGSILITATGSGGAGGYEFNWNTPSGMDVGNTYNATLSGPHFVTVTDDNGCINTGVVMVTAHPNPEVEIIDPGPICVRVEFFTVMATPTDGTFDGTIISPFGDMNPNLIPPGTYTITYDYTDSNNCSGSDSETITIIPIPESIPDNTGPVCEGQPFTLTGETSGTGASILYHWEGPGGYSSDLQNPMNATLGGTYTLEVTIDGCPSDIAVTTVIVHSQPEAFALNGGPYCNGQAVQLFGSTNASGNTVTYAWTGPNGFTSNVQNPINATAEGIYTLIVNVDNCSSLPVTTEVIFNTPPDAVATNSGPYCAGEAVELFGNTTAPGTLITYNWSGPNGYVSTTQNPNDAVQPGLYQLVVNVDGCNSPTTPTTVTINSLPQPVITGPVAFCIGNSAILDAGAGYSNYLWDDASINRTLAVFTSGTHFVTVTDANGCAGQASFTVSEIPSLTPVILGNLVFCAGSSTILDAGAGYTSYEWSTGGMSQTITVTTGGNIGVIVTDADGCSGSTNITTTVNPNPTVVIGGSTTYCIGGSTILDAGAGYTTYTWNTSETSQAITVSAPGSFTVDVIDGNGCTVFASVNVTESTSLSPVITGNNAFCENGNTTLNAGSGFATYAWSDGSTNQILIVDSAGIYAVTVSDGQSCSGEATVTISEVLPPTAQLQPTTTLCNTTAGGSIINLYSLILSGNATGSWDDVDNSGAVGLFTNLNFNNIAAGDYRFTYTTNSAIAPCPETDYQVIVTILDCTCPDVFFFNAAPLCNAGDVLDLNSIENTSEPGDWVITLSPAGTNPATLSGSVFDATSSDPGTYTLEYTLQNQPPPGCPIDFQIMIEVNASVDAGMALQPVDFCIAENQLIDLTSLISGEDPNGTWKETSTTPSQGAAFNAVNGTFQTVNQGAGTYTFEYELLSNGTCPDDATEVTVIINPIPTAMVDDFVALDCTNPIQSLNATGSSYGSGFDIIWTGPGIIADGNENTLSPTIDQAGMYVLTITNTQSGCINAASVNVIANTDAPTGALISSDDPSCFGDQNGYIHVDQVQGGDSPYQFSLNTAAFGNNNVFNNLTAGGYTIDVVDANGCKWDTTITLVEPGVITIDLGPDIELGLGEHGMVQAIVNLAPNQMDTLIWSPDKIIECIDFVCLEANVYASNSVTLSATVYDLNGCAATDDIFVLVNKIRKVYVPNVFSPNGDGINDIFFIMGDEDQIVGIKKFMVFSRWGETIFETLDFLPNDDTKGWDGYFKNEMMNPGVFVYYAEVEYIDGFVQVLTGDVTIMK